jgi:type III restriction enzyme
VFLNSRRERSRDDITELPPNLRSLAHEFRSASGTTRTGIAFGTRDTEVSTKLHHSTRRFSELPPSIAGTALRQDERLRFDRLRRKFPNLTSSRQFITDGSYLGKASITVASRNETPSRAEWLKATVSALGEVASKLDGIDIEHYGTMDFIARPLREVITDRSCLVSEPKGDGRGIPQSIATEELRLNLPQLEWYGYEENYGTTEEKRFLRFFSTKVDEIAQHLDLFVVLRNEGQFAIYDSDGAPFQPDFLLLLHEARGDHYLQYQVFIEPKGEGWVEKDSWKEDLLLRLEQEATPVLKFVDDNDYTIWGLPFYTHKPEQELKRFVDEFQRLIESGVPSAD